MECPEIICSMNQGKGCVVMQQSYSGLSGVTDQAKSETESRTRFGGAFDFTFG